MLKRILFLICIILFSTSVFSQFYSTGEDPSFIKWKQIKTDHFQVIFPEDCDSSGQLVANYLEYTYSHVSKGLNHNPRPISVLLHSYSSKSNGMVVWTPKRMELYSNPPQDNYPQDWFQQLAIHELRHVVQIDKLQQGLTQILFYLFGEQATGLVSSMVPAWLLEGDAVYTETVLSKTGRGRLASFDKELRALRNLEKGLFSYDKILHGSYKDYVPDHYRYGYQMTLYGRKYYGNDIWEHTFDYIGQNPFLIYPSYFSIKKHTGLSRKNLYKRTFNYLDSIWTDFEKKQNVKHYPVISTQKKEYTNYLTVKFLNDSTIVSARSCFSTIPEFITLNIHTRKEKVFHKPGFFNDLTFSVSNNKLTWNEYNFGIRWAHQTYNSIKTFDFEKSKTKQLSYYKRYQSPAYSNKGNNIAIIENLPQYKCKLHILHAQHGYIVQSVDLPKGMFAQTPCWTENDSSIVFSFVNDEGKGMASYNIKSKTIKTLLPASNYNISHPLSYYDKVYFIADYEGIDNIYCLNSSGSIIKITNVAYGVGDFDIQNNQLAFTTYQSDGYQLALEQLPDSGNEIDISQLQSRFKDIDSLAKTHEQVVDFEKLNLKNFKTTKYYKATHKFNFHSWTPFYYDIDEVSSFDPNDLNIKPGVTVFSQNKLNTSELTMAYEYDKRHIGHLKYSYKGWVPKFDIGLNYGEEAFSLVDDNISAKPNSITNALDYYISTNLPLKFTFSKWISGIRPQITLSYSNFQYVPVSEFQYKTGHTSLDSRLIAYTQLRQAQKDLYPKWGVITELRNYRPVFDPSFGNNSYIYQTVYLPSFFKNHGIKAEAGYLKQSSKKYLNYSLLPVPRGITRRDIVPEQLYTLKLNYYAPILYPDVNIGSLLYIKRIKTKLFFDYAEMYKRTRNENSQIVWTKYRFNTCGIELTADFNVFRSRLEINSGVRAGYNIYTHSTFFEFIYSASLPY